MTNKTNRYVSPEQRRKQRDDRAGLALIAFCLISLAAMFYGGAKIDQAHGISVSQSLHSWGL